MCQLTFADLGKRNKLYMTNQLILNAMDNNPDGVGVLTKGTVWKSPLAANLIINLGSILGDFLGNEPIIGHVRSASNKLMDKVEHSHPFEGKLLIQAHNGRLEPNDWKIRDTKKVDSENFLHYLEEKWLAEPNLAFHEILPKVMEDWKGKFAFMYYVKQTKDYYIIRGESAKLHYATVDGRLVVNTEQKSLYHGLDILSQIYQLTTKETLKIKEIEEVEKNSIFKFDANTSSLVKVGEIKEESLPTYTVWNGRSTIVSNYSSDTVDDNTIAAKLDKYINNLNLSIEEVDHLSLICMGNSLIELSAKQIDAFIDDFLDILTDKVTLPKSALWTNLRRDSKTKEAYEHDLVFPWMYNSEEELQHAVDNLVEVKNDPNP